jgi:hypothetical protein
MSNSNANANANAKHQRNIVNPMTPSHQSSPLIFFLKTNCWTAEMASLNRPPGQNSDGHVTLACHVTFAWYEGGSREEGRYYHIRKCLACDLNRFFTQGAYAASASASHGLLGWPPLTTWTPLPLTRSLT